MRGPFFEDVTLWPIQKEFDRVHFVAQSKSSNRPVNRTYENTMVQTYRLVLRAGFRYRCGRVPARRPVLLDGI